MIFLTPEQRRARYKPHKSRYELDRAYDLYIPEVKPIIQIDGNTLLTRDNIMIIGGRAKSGKTYVVSALIANAIYELDCAMALGFTVEKIWQYDNVWSHKHVLHFDTEQQEPEYKNMLNDICRRRGLSDRIPDYLCSYSLSGKNISDILPFIQKTCEFYSKQNGGIHLVFIDNLTDLIESVNDEKMATVLMRDLAILAKKHECAIVGVIHENEKTANGGGLRGHIGSQAQRKAQSVLIVNKERNEKNENYHIIDFPIMRSGSFENKVKFSFDYKVMTMRFNEIINHTNACITQITIDEDYKTMREMIKKILDYGSNQYNTMNTNMFHSQISNLRGKLTSAEYIDRFITKALERKLITVESGGDISYCRYGC